MSTRPLARQETRPLTAQMSRRRRSMGFNPISLFSAGEQGIWLEPSDLTTMFSDRAGTTPVTTPGTVVGLRLDKSKGLVLGSELITNGDFAAGTTGWALTSPGSFTVSGGVATITSASTGSTLRQTIASVVVGRRYTVSFDIISVATNTLRMDVLGSGDNWFFYSPGATGRKTVSVVAQNTVLDISCYGNSVVSVDNISVKALPGNHAVAPTDAARPTYGVEPKTGRRNLLTFTEQFDNAAWTRFAILAFGSGSTVNAASAPDGTVTADLITEDSTNNTHNISSATISAAATSAYSISAYFKRAAGVRDAYIQVNNNGTGVGGAVVGSFDLTSGASTVSVLVAGFTGVTASAVSVGTSGWYRCTLSFTTVASTTTLVAFPGIWNAGRSYTGDGTSGILLWGTQLETGSSATAYQRVGTAFDVTEVGVPTVHYVQYDGTDDSFSTSSIDFSATDKMSVFAGVMKLSDAAQGVLAELSATIVSNNGSFLLAAPDGATATFGFDSKGTIQVDAVASSLTAPITRLVTGLADIAGDTATIRINGVQADQDTGDQGTGNFGNYPIFIGRRNNATLPFNGRDYGIIIVGKTASATEITNTESYLAANTSGVTL